MGEFLAAPQNAPFVWAFIVLVALTLLAVVASLAGMINLDTDADLDGAEGAAESVLEFLGAGAMPLSIFAVVACSTFFAVGFFIQEVALIATKSFLPGWMAIVPALIVMVLTTRATGRLAARVNLKAHTEAVHAESFVGRIATISQGEARVGLPAQAKLRDQHGATHYVLVEPIRAEDRFAEGTEVALLERRGPRFLVAGTDLEDLLALTSSDQGKPQ